MRAYLLLTFTALCWGANAIFGRLAVGEISPMALVGLRWLSVLLLLFIFVRHHVRRDWPVLRQHMLYVIAMGILGFTVFNALFYIAAHSTSAVNIGIIQGAIPVFVLIGAFLAYRTKVTLLQVAGVILTMLGVLIVGIEGQFNRLVNAVINHGDLLMVIACVFYAGYAVGLRRRPPISAFALFTMMAGSAFPATIPLVIAEVALGHFQWPTTKGWLIVGLVAVFPSLIAQIFFIKGVELIGPGRAGVFVNLVPVFASILAVTFLKESFETFHAIALTLVLGGIGLSEFGKPSES